MNNEGAAPADAVYKILMVEDSPVVRGVIKKHCSPEGIEVVEAGSGASARETLRAMQPDLVVLNMVLPDANGLDLCREIRTEERLKWVPVIILTALGDLRYLREGYDCGADDYIVKPFQPEEFVLRVKSRIRRARAMSYETFHDALTGCHTRGYFVARVEEEIFRSRREGTLFSLLLADLDDFKQVNDTHGHLVGDHVLREFGAVLWASFRQTDVVARYGGEEFAVLMPKTDLAAALAAAERAREAWLAHPLTVPGDGARLRVTFSGGVVEGGRETAGVNEILAAADRALYAAKAAGEDRIVAGGYLLPKAERSP
ncbi:diguanylate cyclase [Candidatus Desulforudis audaxviator]|uniref:Stage 0 sporulation protein A homolog n=1 Tax=Desulforudis audaxviator (strain MP104C) TaxID=477974 RepID=B1I1W8_DESAP|nr:diguanylate cyclase [Candidatus Desulforudis audaxviator]ACA58931.1 response regulator receiver modulated diguanylate cyclase [Candidatus Desulforudis audaxviator MP104C]AZK58956.1 response regulator/GGDEF domain protein [Candidatus Desulforudis audaxviator]